MSDPIIGKTFLGSYTAVALLGRGGMASVYQVKAGSQRLALKLLHPNLAQDPILVDYFHKEAQIQSSLKHPNIVRVHRLGRQQQYVFILMDYLPGGSLHQQIANTAGVGLPPPKIIEIMRPICQGLAFAHQQSYLHCDLKPTNILLDHADHWLITDFGLARSLRDGRQAGEGAGTPEYMAPEQICDARLTSQTDVYALGVIVYELLTGGQRPFRGDQAPANPILRERIYWEQTHLEPPSPQKYKPVISPALSEVVLRCLNRDPARRYPNAQAFFQALEQAAQDNIPGPLWGSPQPGAASGWPGAVQPETEAGGDEPYPTLAVLPDPISDLPGRPGSSGRPGLPGRPDLSGRLTRPTGEAARDEPYPTLAVSDLAQFEADALADEPDPTLIGLARINLPAPAAGPILSSPAISAPMASAPIVSAPIVSAPDTDPFGKRRPATEAAQSVRPAGRTGRNARFWGLIAGLCLLALASGLLAVWNRFSGQAAPLAASPTPGVATVTPTPPASPTPQIKTALSVLALEGSAYYQVPQQALQELRPGAAIPQVADTRVWTTSGRLQLKMDNGNLVYLDQNTTVYLTLLPQTSQDEPASGLSLERGNLLVQAVAAPQTIESRAQAYWGGLDQGATAGFVYDSMLNYFWVDCLTGQCFLSHAAEMHVVASGTRAGYGRDILEKPGAAPYELWFQLAGPDVVPAPPPSPTPPPPSALHVLAQEGSAYYQAPQQALQELHPGADVPQVADTRVWSVSGSVQFEMDNGNRVYLDANTTVYLTILPQIGQGEPASGLSLEDGNLLVQAVAAPQTIETKSRPYWGGLDRGATAGFIYEALANNFWIDCLAGRCFLSKSTEMQDVVSGTRAGYEQGFLEAPGAAPYKLWIQLTGPGVIPTRQP